jgi:HD-GYP domain-containing protein (c-di-GMP phosphodiesterase class II)
MGVTRSNADAIEIAALLHDVGKIGISEATLGKAGRLTKEEVAAIREHPSKSMIVLSEVEFLAEMVPIVHAHHERIDGTGYPRGLRGDEIPYEARLLAVADTYDAMTSDRPYRAALSDDEAISELESAAGTQLDSRVVAVMLEYLRELPDVPTTAGANPDEA